MIELLASSESTPTPLAARLAGTGATTPLETISYLGAQTPRQLDAPEAETGALLFSAAIHDLGWLRRFAVRGEDRFRWLSGMVTNAVDTLPGATGAYNLVLNAQGRIQGDCYVWRDGDSLEIETTAAQAEALLAHFDRFIIMDDVELVPLEGESALGITGPQAENVLKSLGIATPAEPLSSASGQLAGIPVRIFRGHGTIVPHFAIWGAEEAIADLWQSLSGAGATPAGAEALETLRIAEGIPTCGIDIQSRDLAQETGQMRAISFTKGCYLGQEIVERVRSRGQVHRHLRALELFLDDPVQLPPVGAELRIGSDAPDAKIAGTLTSVAALQLGNERRIFAIGMVRAEAEVGTPALILSGERAIEGAGGPTGEPAGGTARILNSPPKFTQA